MDLIKLRGLGNKFQNVGDGGGHITCMMWFFYYFNTNRQAESSLVSNFEECIAFFIHVTLCLKIDMLKSIFTTRNIIFFLSKKIRNTSIDIMIQLLVKVFVLF